MKTITESAPLIYSRARVLSDRAQTRRQSLRALLALLLAVAVLVGAACGLAFTARFLGL